MKNNETRILFCISLEGTARKLITVKSALTVVNKLQDSIEIKVESLNTWQSKRNLNYYMVLQPNTTSSLPVDYVNSLIWIRPAELSIGFCNRPVKWQDTTQSDQNVTKNDNVICYPTASHLKPYKFCVQVNRENYPLDTFFTQPGHNITLIAPITIINLLPCDLRFRMKGAEMETGCVKAGKENVFTSISVDETVELVLNIDNFSQGAEFVIPPGTSNFLAKMCVYDSQNRPLVIHVRVYHNIGGSLQLHVSVPYWFINKTGLPLMFKQDGMHTEVAGQGEEHEMARSVAPLMFSFADPEMSAMCSMRLGKSVHLNGTPLWCTRFHLEKGVRVRPLRVSPYESRPDWVYVIGVEVRVGRGRYHDTLIVTLTPRFQINNHSTHKLEITQKFASTNYNPHLLSFPKCSLPFHWPRIDLEQLLCVRIADIPGCHWSGGIKIDKTDSFHINIRDQDCNIHFIHVEIVLQGATYFIVFTNADKMPAPYRVNNLSEVPVTFYQRDVSLDRLRSTVRAHSSLVYAWDEPMLPPYVTCVAPGGSSTSCNMNKFGSGNNLYYENFIYIAFTGTFHKDGKKYYDECEELVLDAPHGTKIVLSKKEPGNRSQLWRMNMQSQLEHEGSNPPQDPRKSSGSSAKSKRTKFVLDLAGIGPQPDCYTPLMLRKSDDRRRSTQTWRFTEDGRLCCAYNNMYVQANDGFYGLKAGNEVVLGLSQPVSHARMTNGIPVEQAVERQRFRSGSGVLSVSVVPDGPTRVLRIVAVPKSSSENDFVVVEERNCEVDVGEISSNNPVKSKQFEFQLDVQLNGGIGLSLINSVHEELVYCILFFIEMNYVRHPSNHTFKMTIENLQVDSQLMKAECPITLYVTPSSQRDAVTKQPAIHIKAFKNPMPNMNAEIFQHFYVTMKNITLNIEEILLCKLVQFFSAVIINEEEEADENSYSSQRNGHVVPSSHAKRYYFGMLKIVLNVVRLSVLTSSNLSPNLALIKRNMGWTLMRFEDAQVELDDFCIIHSFETATFLINSVLQHYREELKGQAAKIFGSFDFLGNPLGLVQDVSEGVSTLLNDGNVGGLLKNVTHGLSDSAAKVTGSLSEGLGKVTMDNNHEMLRQKMRSDRTSSSSEHLVAGLKGFGHGLLGGVTSLITQTYSGAANEGVQGFFSGIGKGLVGTVTKPAAGVLDLATGAASAVRDTSRNERRVLPPKIRLSRLCLGPNGALPIYSVQQAHGQEYLYTLNDRNYNENLIAFEVLFSGSGGLKILISNKMIRVISSEQGPVKVVLQISYSDLFFCKYITNNVSPSEVKHFIELTRRVDGSSPGQNALKRPQVRCNDGIIAQKVAQEINYAKTMYEEIRQSLASSY
ncbi:Vacuolar protein sorting-associated protein 13D [Nymphon striatum]|nr:Vacuolar protein sorting-associated protein 13D [Nymphon striatum]